MAGDCERARAVRWLALPIADAAGLTAAAAVNGGGREVRGRVLCALYLVAVLIMLAAGQMHRLRICLRVADQADRVLIAMAVPAIALLAWLPAARVLWLATWSGGLLQHSPLGRRLRTTHLDELPQLINVMRGEMSLVGPRPERPYFSERFSREVPRYADRTRMPSGMAGWAQVSGLNGDTSIFGRARFDNHYTEHWSIWLDLVILARTAATVFRGIWAAGEPEDRRGARAGGGEAR